MAPATTLPNGALIAISLFIVIAIPLTAIRLYTGWQYQRSLKLYLDESNDASWAKPQQPPQIPYAIPWLGNTIAFFEKQPGQQWHKLFSWHPRSTGVFSLLIGGKTTNILFNPISIQALFKDKRLSRDVMDAELYDRVFAMPSDQVHSALRAKPEEHAANVIYLLRTERVNELTTKFIEFFVREIGKDIDEISVSSGAVGLNQWLRKRMFNASVTALFGDHVLEEYPEYWKDFFLFEKYFTAFFFQLPNFLMGGASAVRNRCFEKLALWNKKVYKLAGNQIPDPEGPSWEPLFGSRINRSRQLHYRANKYAAPTMAALDFGMTFGLNTNAVHATGWMLMETFNPKSGPNLYPQIMKELQRAHRPADGSIDVPTLLALPLVQSLWTETLRFYMDALVIRNLTEDATLPLDEDGKRVVKFKKGGDIMMPTWIGRNNAAYWNCDGAPVDEFWAERFLIPDPDRPGERMFSLAGTTGVFFPFGGGRTICPGRVFAKQEAFAAFASILLKVNVKVEGFLDDQGNDTDRFPSFTDGFPGSGAIAARGDIKVRLSRRNEDS